MTDQEFNELLAECEEQNVLAATKKHAAAMREIARAEAVNLRIAELMTASTGLSLTQADKVAHTEPAHRAAQREVAVLALEADIADRKARALGFALGWAVAARRSEYVRLEPVL